MAPREPSLERTDEYEQFMQDLAAFHEARGTTLEREPRLGSRRIDLLKLYKHVCALGGYDAASAEKKRWQKIGVEFGLSPQNVGTVAFQLKTVYYKNLAAYEIVKVHGREPPPKEILEDITARGGGLLTRTLENFQPPGGRESGANANGVESDNSGDESKTPKADKMDVDGPDSGIRSTRGLRQAPPQRVLFQPDISSTRQARQVSQTNSPAPVATSANNMQPSSNATNPLSASFNISLFEPKPPAPLTAKPVVTPATHPERFRHAEKLRRAPPTRGFDPLSHMAIAKSPNIYLRCLYGLRSGVDSEVDFALHHLVKVSHERGDKFKFEGFPFLAEALIEKALEVTMLVYDVKFKVSYDLGPSLNQLNVLNGVSGTHDLRARLASLPPVLTNLSLETPKFLDQFIKIREAFLCLRNMIMLEDNAQFMLRVPLIQDLMVVALSLPSQPRFDEIRHNALDICEQLTRFWFFWNGHPLLEALLDQILTEDRGFIVTAMHSILNTAVALDRTWRLTNVPDRIVNRAIQWILVDDDVLLEASLKFLYQYTATPENVEHLITKLRAGNVIMPVLMKHLARDVTITKQRVLTMPAERTPVPTKIPIVPADLVSQLARLSEPDRSARWLKCCFIVDAEADVTQISLWQAYQSTFANLPFGAAPLLPASEFIRSVSTAFATAAAQVLQDGGTRFIIKGIRPRDTPLDFNGNSYRKCCWLEGSKATEETECSKYFSTELQLCRHIADDHMHLPRDTTGSYIFEMRDKPSWSCRWKGCTRFRRAPSSSVQEMIHHITIHVPKNSPAPEQSQQASTPAATTVETANVKETPRLTDSSLISRPAEYSETIWYNTPQDTQGNATGASSWSIHILRNLARHIPKTAVTPKRRAFGDIESSNDISYSSNDEDENRQQRMWIEEVFAVHKGQLWNVWAQNPALGLLVLDLLGRIEKAEGLKKGELAMKV